MAFYLQQFSWRYPCIICCSSFFDPESAHDLHAFVVWFTVCMSNHIQTQWLVLMRGRVACLVWMGRVSLCDIVCVFFVHVLTVLSFQCFVSTQLSCTDNWVKWNLPEKVLRVCFVAVCRFPLSVLSVSSVVLVAQWVIWCCQSTYPCCDLLLTHFN